MKKTLIAFAAAATIATGLMSAQPAEARCYGCAVGAGVVAGVAAGAIIGSAAAGAWGPRYAPAPGYVVYADYGQPVPVACPGGYWARKARAFDAYGNPVAWSKPRFICP